MQLRLTESTCARLVHVPGVGQFHGETKGDETRDDEKRDDMLRDEEDGGEVIRETEITEVTPTAH